MTSDKCDHTGTVAPMIGGWKCHACRKTLNDRQYLGVVSRELAETRTHLAALSRATHLERCAFCGDYLHTRYTVTLFDVRGDMATCCGACLPMWFADIFPYIPGTDAKLSNALHAARGLLWRGSMELPAESQQLDREMAEMQKEYPFPPKPVLSPATPKEGNQ